MQVILGASLLVAATGWNAYRANEEIFRASTAYPVNATQTIAGSGAAISLDPGRADYYNYRGLGYQLAGSFASAASDFEVATRLAPYQYPYWINLSRSRLFQFQNGDRSGGGAAAALAAAKRGVELDPRIHAPHRNYAEVALALGDPALAFDEARIAFAMYTLDPLTESVLASSAALIPDHELARRTLQAALERTNSPALWAGLAKVHLAAGNPTAARAAALRALELDPANSDAKSVLAATGG
jgi:tetratricopeptide (TPR) repeat protein